MPKDIFYAVKHIMSTNGVIRCKKNFCKNIRKITGMKSIYVQNLVNNFSGEIPFFPIFKCSNDQITFVVEKALAKVQVSNLNKQIIFRINDNGTNVECVCSNEKFNKDKLCEFVAFYDKKSSQYNCEIWRYDAVFLCFKVMEIVANLNLDFYTEIKNMPSFYIAERVVFTDKNIPYLASKLSEKFDVSYNNNSMIFHNGNVKLHCFDEGNSKKIRLLAQNVKAENAEEFATEIINFLQGHI